MRFLNKLYRWITRADQRALNKWITDPVEINIAIGKMYQTFTASAEPSDEITTGKWDTGPRDIKADIEAINLQIVADANIPYEPPVLEDFLIPDAARELMGLPPREEK